jgi:NAD(P) transhydrogenase subunit alpha
MVKIVVLKEDKSESRVALTPDVAAKYVSAGFQVMIEKDAGLQAGYPDVLYQNEKVEIVKDTKALLKDADLVLSVNAPDKSDLMHAKKGTCFIAMMNPHRSDDYFKAFEKQGLSCISLELVPRISRAQSMDVLSSQSNLAGYRAVIEASHSFGRAFPMMMTAAGTVPPARVFVMGAGVAGLQAIATAKRLGAIVSATDVRPAAKEQVESLGGSFVMVESDEMKEAETSGGYAKEMSKDFQKAQAELIAKTITKQDIVITTALIPGRPAPVLVSAEMVASMKPGSVIVDMAVSQGGNCALSEKDKIADVNGVKIVGYQNLPARIPTDTSRLYAKNIEHLLKILIKEDKLVLDVEDEIIKAILLIKDGQKISDKTAA